MITQGKIGGSLTAAIAGLHPRKTRFEAFLDIMGMSEKSSGLAAKIGHAMEPVTREEYVLRTGAKLLGPRTVTNLKYPWAEGHLDDETDTKVIELKTVTLRLAHEYGDGTDDLPIQHICQVQTYMGLTEKDLADVVVLVGNEDVRIYELKADKELQGMLFETCAKFHRDHIATGKPPPVDGSEGCAEWIANKYPRESKPLIPADLQSQLLVERYVSARDALEAATEAKERAYNELTAFIGDSEGILGANYKCTFKAQKGRAAIDWGSICRHTGLSEAMAKQQFMKQGEAFRVLRYSEKKQ